MPCEPWGIKGQWERACHIMIKSVVPDLLFICAELVTGKSIPVLVGITRLPVGQVLTWAMVSMGAIAGTLFSVWAAHNTVGMTLLGFINRLLQLCFSLCLSLSLVLSLAGGVHAERGVALAVIPAFCSVVQPLPQRHSTALVSFGLCCVVVYVCMITPLASEPFKPALVHPVVRRSALEPPDAAAMLSLGEVVGRAIQLFVLAFYACIQHAPTQLYFQVEGGGEGAVYASHHHARHAVYTLFVGFVSAWIRLSVWSSVCFFQDNQLHGMLGNEPGVGTGWDWACCIVYATALLFSACWTATQLGEQVLPRFCVGSRTGGLKFVALILGVATLFRQRAPFLMFWAANLLVGSCVLSSVFSVKGL